jgi:CheY-like chemotaxis protein
MPDGGVLTVSGSNVTLSEGDRMPRPKLALGDYAVLTVVDTGTGMDASVQSRIFEPFFTTKVAGLGTGLGLSTVFEIVKGMSGAIRVSSELGAGTVFRIYLPRTATVATLLPTAATASVAGGSERVLIVEDEEAVLQLVGDTLRRNGYSVLTALGAEQALAVVAGSDRPIDLVVTDVMMPNGTGPDLVAELDRTTTCRRALYMSGYAGAALARQGKLAADSEFLQKPFTGMQLLAKVRELLDSAAV